MFSRATTRFLSQHLADTVCLAADKNTLSGGQFYLNLWYNFNDDYEGSGFDAPQKEFWVVSPIAICMTCRSKGFTLFRQYNYPNSVMFLRYSNATKAMPLRWCAFFLVVSTARPFSLVFCFCSEFRGFEAL